MRTSFQFGDSGRQPAGNKRRPAGVSRRQQRRLGMEPLEDRRMMSADSGVAAQAAGVNANIYDNMVSLSSDTPEGYLAILQNELYWQALQEASLANATSSVNSGVTTYSVPTDPYVGLQWHLINSGQLVSNPDFQAQYGVPGEDINVAPVWDQNIFGNGVVVAVIDSGVQTTHPDLIANINAELQKDFLDGDNNATPRPDISGITAHGTAVAGIIAATANNGIGGTGVAPGATIIPIRLIDVGQTEQAFVNTFRYLTDQIDITNNSWGPTVVRGLAGPTAAELLAIRDSIFFGRGGLGVIHVFSSGNDGANVAPIGFPNDPTNPNRIDSGLDSSSYDGWVNSRYTIGVTGVDHDGKYENDDGTVTSYFEMGTSVLVAAPSGSNAIISIGDDTGLGSGILTTDLVGGEYNGIGGFNIKPDPVTGEEYDRDFFTNTDYTSRFNGTSAAAPMVSGVIALMLEANPNLSWRDVQEILVRSARQNSQFDVPEGGYDLGVNEGLPNQITVGGTQNTWITNQMPVFHDPDTYDPTISPVLQTVFPTLDPNLTGVDSGDGDFNSQHYQPIVSYPTNGAGYTVSLGRGTKGEMIGFAHGVVDAELAVALAQQWSTKGQSLPAERTFSTYWLNPIDEVRGGTIPALEISDDDSGNQTIPGALGGTAGFSSYWNEYFTDAPFSDPNPPDNTRGAPLFFTVPQSNAMSVETVEVKISLSGGTADALDNLRILLVSPNGTQSELNNFYVEQDGATFQNVSPFTYLTDGRSQDNGGQMVWTFNTNRSWGERSDDDLVFNPQTGLPFINTTGFESLRGNHTGGDTGQQTPATLNAALKGGWQLQFENYGGTPFTLDGVEVVWHGSPIAANTKRIQGFVGVDADRNDDFNFTRLLPTTTTEIDGDPNTVRFFEVQNQLDLEQEPFAANVTVIARRASDGVIVDRFITGADGNYYFDLVPGDYIISVEDADGRTAVEDTATGAGLLQHYKTEWHITEDWFNVWDRTATQEVPVDANGVPLPWIDGNGGETPYHVKQINFLLDPGAPPAEQADFTGVVYADTNGDGVFNSDDVNLSNIVVYGDVNRNGARDAGEPIAITDATGHYALTVPIQSASVLNVSVSLPANWQFTNPAGGIITQFANLGDTFSGVDFAIAPPLNSAPGVGTTEPGIILGYVYEDAISPQGSRQTGEVGVPGITVYVDVNASGALDAGDIQTVTNERGAFAFTELPPQSNYQIRIVVASPFSQIVPFFNGPYTVSLASGDTVSGVAFGVKNSATLDYGDLPNIYGATTLAQNGARALKGNFYLGDYIDVDVNGVPSADALGDDNIGTNDDEDGVTFTAFKAGEVNTITVKASRAGGRLTAWVDFNNDGDFDDVGERLVMTNLTGTPVTDTKLPLGAGLNTITFTAPATIVGSNVYARFRYGVASDPALDSIHGGGTAQGEIEDYLIPVEAVSPTAVVEDPDANGNGRIDGSDFLAWQRNAGKTSGATTAQGDANGDGAVNGADLGIWDVRYGEGIAATPVPATGDFNADGSSNGDDFLAWQRGAGKVSGANLYYGDGNGDGSVNSADLAVWQAQYGSGGSAAEGIFTTTTTVAAAATNSLTSGSVQAAPTSDGENSSVDDSLLGIVQFAAAGSSRGEQAQAPVRSSLHEAPGVAHRVDRLESHHRDDVFGELGVGRLGLRRHRSQEVADGDDSDGDDVLSAAFAAPRQWLL